MVTEEKPIQIDEICWRLRFTSDRTPPIPFRIYREGRLVSSFDSDVASGEIDITASDGEFPFVEILDQEGALPSLAYPGHITLHWSGVSGSASYRVEEFFLASWKLRQIVSDNGQGAFTWLSRWLEDETQHQFRVIPMDIAGNLGTPLPLSVTMVRHPDTPVVDYVYNGSGTPTVTISG